MRTDHFVRFERVDSVEQTERGLLARLHGERLRVEAVRSDVVRVQLSRGGTFDGRMPCASTRSRTATALCRGGPIRVTKPGGSSPTTSS